MKNLLWSLFFLALTSLYSSWSESDEPEVTKEIYAVEFNGSLCGFSEINVEPDSSGKTVLKQFFHTNLSALGSNFVSEIRLTYHLTESGGFDYHDSQIDQGDTHLSSIVKIKNDEAVFDYGDGTPVTVPLSSETILENTYLFPHLVADFSDGTVQEKTYSYLEVRDAAVQKKTYKLTERIPLELGGKIYKAIGFEQFNLDTGLRFRIWIDEESGKLLKSEMPGNRTSYLADSSVKKRLTVANLDGNISSQANISIGDYQGITYMKIEAEANPTGIRVTEADLNVPGQSFVGTVHENQIRGVFEIEHPRYSQDLAPPFPFDHSQDSSLEKYLKPDDFIESDDEVLMKKARDIVEGSKDSWEAATRIGKWVEKNIDYTIPGGVTARKTFDIRAGECGAHSFLTAAFCRSVGIPARVVWGAMYVPNRGGLFGQHAWNEVYMGEAGWVPIDTTASESDYLDSGHIRMGEYQSISTALNPVRFEILDYRIGGASDETSNMAHDDYSTYLGRYLNPQANQEIKVEFKDSSLVMDIVGKTALAVHPPNAEGAWISKISETVYFIFSSNESGEVDELTLHQVIRMARKEEADSPSAPAPEEWKAMLGKYLFRQVNAEFTVLIDQGQLAINDPMAKKIIHLKPILDSERWIDEFDKNQVYFEKDPDGKITHLVLDSINRFNRIPSNP